MKTIFEIDVVLSGPRLLKVFVFLLACSPILRAQPTIDQIGIPTRGVVPNGSYALTKIETIDTFSGNVSIHIPMASLPAGRAGFSHAVDLYYNSSIFTDFLSVGEIATVHLLSRSDLVSPDDFGGWHYGYNVQIVLDRSPGDSGCSPFSPQVYYRYRLVLPDGSSHPLYVRGRGPGAGGNGQAYQYWDDPMCGSYTMNGTVDLFTADGTNIRAKLRLSSGIDLPFRMSWAVYFPDGRTFCKNANTTLTITNCPSTGDTTITDRNGNVITITNFTDTDTGSTITRLQDAFERTIDIEHLLVSDPDVVQDKVHYSGFGGTPLITTIDWTQVTLAHGHAYACIYPGPADDCDAGGTDGTADNGALSFPAVSKITLPVTGLSYDFAYAATASSEWGQLSHMKLPSLATVDYTYGPLDFNFVSNAGEPYPVSVPIGSKNVTWTDENSANATRIETSLYAFTDHLNGYGTSIFTNPDGGVLRTDYYARSAAGTNPYIGLAYKTTKPSGETHEQLWNQNIPYGSGDVKYPGNPFVKYEFDSVASGTPATPALAAAKTHSVDRNGNQSAIAETDWFSYSSLSHLGTDLPVSGFSPGTTLRTTINKYLNPAISTPDEITNDSNGYWNDRDHNLLNLICSSIVAESPGSKTEFLYDGSSTPCSETPDKGNVTSVYRYPDAATMTHDTTTNVYDVTTYLGNLLSTTSPRNIATAYTYDANHLYITRINKDSVARTLSYGHDFSSGLLTSITDNDHGSWVRSFTYDSLGRLLTDTEGDIRKTSTEYVDSTRTITEKSDLHAPADLLLARVTDVDQLGRVRAAHDPAGNIVKSLYLTDPITGGNFNHELASNPYATTSDPTMGWTRTKKDTAGRTIEVAHFSGSGLPVPWGSNSASTGVLTTSYDSNCSTTSDEALSMTNDTSRTSCVDGLGRLISVRENGLAATTTYAYDALDSLISVTQPGSAPRTFAYDSLKRLTSATNPESGTTGYTYDGDGNVATRTDARSVTTTYAYDSLDQVTTKSYNDTPRTPTATYTYDHDWLSSVAVDGGTSYTYTAHDTIGRVTAASQTTSGTNFGFVVAHTPSVGVKSIQYPITGRIVTTNYDDAGRPKNVTGEFGIGGLTYYVGDASTDIQYAAHGGITSMKLGNGVTETRVYNSRLQPTQIAVGGLLTLGYCYRSVDCTTTSTQPQNNGNVLQQSITRGSSGWIQNYVYDSVNRLTSAAESGAGIWSQSYGYNTRGNRWVTGTGLPTPTNEVPQADTWFGTNNRVTAPTAWTYDLAGNILAVGGMSRSFTYDAESRQRSAMVNGQTTTYAYDGDGRRVQKNTSLNTTVFVYDPFGQLALEYGTATNTGTKYLHADALGSTRMVTTATGTVDSNFDYLPFGEEIGAGTANRNTTFPGSQYPHAASAVNLEFTSKERDAETGLDFFGARYMSSAQGRFTSPDWSEKPEPVPYADFTDPQTLNLYIYGRNNPLRNRDDDGHCTVDGEQHFGWCIWHTLGFYQTKKEVEATQQAWANLGAQEYAKTHADFNPSKYTPQQIRQMWDNGVFSKTREDPLDPLQLLGVVSVYGGGPKPKLESNPKHNPNSSSAEPGNVKELFEKSVEDSSGVRWAKDANGTIHRFSRPSNGSTHWNGSTSGPDPIRTDNIPIAIRNALK